MHQCAQSNRIHSHDSGNTSRAVGRLEGVVGGRSAAGEDGKRGEERCDSRLVCGEGKVGTEGGCL